MHQRVPENQRSHLIFKRRSTMQEQTLKKIKFSLLQTQSGHNSLIQKKRELEKKRKVKQGKLEHLLRKLRKQWDKFDVPEYHRCKFLAKVNRMPLSVSCVQISSEIQNFWNGQSTVLEVINSIKRRESILKSLAEFIDQIKSRNYRSSVIQLKAIDMLKQLRVYSLNVVEAVKDWQSSFAAQCDFEWEGQKYLEKMQTDFLFLVSSPLKDLVFFEENCSSLFYYETTEFPNQALISIKSSLLPRLAHAEEFLNKKKGLKASEHTEEIKHESERRTSLPTLTRRLPKLNSDELDHISNIICEDTVQQVSHEALPVIIKISHDQMLSACLVLFSSKVVNRYIDETLRSLVLEVAEIGLQEVLDVEYIEFQIQLTYISCEAELQALVEEIALEEIAISLSEDYSLMINYREIVSEAIREEKLQNKQLMNCIYDEMYEEVLREEWFELIIEEVVGNANLDYMWESLPNYVQSKLFLSRPQKINSRIAEMIYSDILNNLIGDIWVRSILRAAIRRNDDDRLDEIMPIPKINSGGYIKRSRAHTIIL